MADANPPDDFYERLGVPRTATFQQIKQAYRKKATETHPDSGGDKETFIALTEAYEVLSNPETRAAYDRGEYKGHGGNPHSSPSETPDASTEADPYLTPNAITWSVGDGHTPEPVVVRLSNRGGLTVTKFGPQKMRGDFWAIDNWDIVMEGDDLVDYTFTPADDIPESQKDKVQFFVDDKTVDVTITVSVLVNPTPPPHDPPRSSSTSWSPLEPSTSSSSTAHARPTRPVVRRRRPKTGKLVGTGICVFLWWFVLTEGFAGFRFIINPFAWLPVIIWFVYVLYVSL